MDLNDKIKQILTDKNISPSIFADEIGIQRSSMSHILAGRNKPSLDIVQKIVRRFPELGTNWILDGEELPFITAESSAAESLGQLEILSSTRNNREPNARQLGRSEKNSLNGKPSAAATNSSRTRQIEKILIFYSDGTFEEVK
ncbi:helix-turn-helix transcriptional regulator [Dyadobacter sp. CY347]|uniref:helix-turn-helix transcriptional regulator n=1 Tax=Dyadobacter sp. CY347 TaxID=2909336 RepID=UPI001F378BF0|nr:helix-turn-helix transcriptional regulator [Dyadobacter sp. CY347]MCF2491320.1 helix-turn-helix domain-containing protein [Dyadobacter sp. CY347]